VSGIYEIGIFVTGITILLQGIPWIVRDWRDHPPEVPGDWASRGLMGLCAFWFGAVVLLLASVFWPATWALIVGWHRERERLARHEEAEHERFLFGKVRHSRRRAEGQGVLQRVGHGE
jgi:hypothetical protein